MDGSERLAHSVPARLSPAEGRKFALTLAGAGAVFALLFTWRGREPAALVAAALAAAMLLAALVVPGRLGPFYRAWMGLSRLISRVTTPVIMGAIYFLVLTPVGLVARLAGHHPMKHEGWQTREEGKRQSDLERQF